LTQQKVKDFFAIVGKDSPTTNEERLCWDWNVDGFLVVPPEDSNVRGGKVVSHRELVVGQRRVTAYNRCKKWFIVRRLPQKRNNAEEWARLRKKTLTFEEEDLLFTLAVKFGQKR
jgi:hypothetical protein